MQRVVLKRGDLHHDIHLFCTRLDCWVEKFVVVKKKGKEEEEEPR